MDGESVDGGGGGEAADRGARRRMSAAHPVLARAGTGWRRLAGLLTLYEKPPPTGPGGRWTPEAARRIAARHGVN